MLSCSCTFQAKVNQETGDATDNLDSEPLKWVASLGSNATTISEIVKTKDPAVSYNFILLQR